MDRNADQVGRQATKTPVPSKPRDFATPAQPAGRAPKQQAASPADVADVYERQVQLVKEIAEVISNRIQSADNYDTRSSWLDIIPFKNRITRNHGSAYDDLFSIGRQLISAGRLSNGRWAISVFIQNAAEGYAGTELGETLQQLCSKLESELKKTAIGPLAGSATTDDRVVHSDSIDPGDKRGLKINTAGNVTRAPDDAADKLRRDEQLKKLKHANQERARLMRELHDFMREATVEIHEVNQCIRFYEDASRFIEPYLKSASLLEDYINLCILYDNEDKPLTVENVFAMKVQRRQMVRNCQNDKFEEWIADLHFPDQADRVTAHKNYCQQVIDSADTLQEQLGQEFDMQKILACLDGLATAVSKFLASWTGAQGKLLEDINGRLDKVSDDLGKRTHRLSA